MNTSTIVHVKPGHVVPEEYLKIVVERCPTVFGFAGRENGKLKCEATPSSVSLPELKELGEAFKDEDLVMFFGNYPKAVLPDDVQPWSLSKPGANNELEHFLLLFFEGGFSKFEGLNGDHTAEFCVSDEVIFPRLDKAFKDAGEDIPKFIESLRQPGIQKSLSNSFDKRGVFLFMPEQGELISFGENDIGGVYPWGTTSNAHGYTEKATVVAQASQAVRSGLSFLRGRGASSTSMSSGTTQPAPAPVPDAPHPDAAPDKKVVEPEPDAGPETRTIDGVVQTKVFPPPKLHGKAENLWVRTFNRGNLPDGYDKPGFHVWVEPELLKLAKTPVSSKGEVENLARGVHNIRKAKNSDVNADMREASAIAEAEAAREILVGKDEKPITRSTVREKHVPSASDYLPVISNSDKEKSLTILSTYLDPKNEKRPSPQEIQNGEKKWPTFSEAIGLKFEELLFIPVKTLNDLFDNNKIAVAAFIEMRRRYIDDSGVKLEDLVLTSTKPEEKGAVVAASVAKSGGDKLSFLRGKSAA